MGTVLQNRHNSRHKMKKNTRGEPNYKYDNCSANPGRCNYSDTNQTIPTPRYGENATHRTFFCDDDIGNARSIPKGDDKVSTLQRERRLHGWTDSTSRHYYNTASEPGGFASNSNFQRQSRGTQVSQTEILKERNYNGGEHYVPRRTNANSSMARHCKSPKERSYGGSYNSNYTGFSKDCVDEVIRNCNNNNNDGDNCNSRSLDNVLSHDRLLKEQSRFSDYNSNIKSTTTLNERYNETNKNCAIWITQSEKCSPSTIPSNKYHTSSSPYDGDNNYWLSPKPFCNSSSSSSLSSLSSVSSASPVVSPFLQRAKQSFSGHPFISDTYRQYYQRRFQRTRKFRLNLFMYANLYRKPRISESSYEIYHNPMEDPDAIYTSFSNPNYFMSRPKTLSTSSSSKSSKSSRSNKHCINNNNNNNNTNASSNDGDDPERVSLASDASGHYSDYSSCEPTPTTPDRSLILHKLKSDDDEYDEYDDLDDNNGGNGNGNGRGCDENRSLIESRSSEDSSCGDEAARPMMQRDGKGSEPHVFYGVGDLPWSKSKGILGYLEMLEKQAMARTAAGDSVGRTAGDERDDGNEDDSEDGEDDKKNMPKANGDGENPNEQQENEKFEHATEINSPDSNDSGIQPGDKILSPDCPSDIEAANSIDRDHKTPTKAQPDKLPDGWQKHEDEDGPYFWHVKSGTIQREPPPPAPPDGPSLCSPRSISLASDSASTSSNSSMPSTPTSVGSITERHLAEFEGNALHYAAKTLQGMSQTDKKATNGTADMTAENGVRYAVRSLGWVCIAEEDLNPERSSKAVNKCIVDLSLGNNDLSDPVGRWGDGKELYMDLDQHSLRLVNPSDGVVLNSQPIHSIRVWGVGRDNGRERDFAYVARDRKTRNHMCHVFHCDVPARQIANTLRDICKKIMLERKLHQSAVARLSRPTDLPNLEKQGTSSNGEKLSFQNLYNNARFPTPMEEPRKTIRCHYLGVVEVSRPTGRDLMNEAIQSLYYRIPPEKWIFVNVAIAPSTITITEHGNAETILEECRVRFLSFMGIAVDNVKLCAFIMHTASNKFICHVFHCEPSAGPLCKTIEAACKLRYQKCMDSHPLTNKSGLQAKSLRSSIKQSIQCVWGSVTNLTSPK